MPVVIEELATTFEIRDEVKIRRLVREEVRSLMEAERRRRAGRFESSDPTDPAAGSGSGDEGRG
jgi:hypothetical protein